MLPTEEFLRAVDDVIVGFQTADQTQMQKLVDELGRMARDPATARMSDRCFAAQARLYAKKGEPVLAMAAVERALLIMPEDEGLLILRGDIRRQVKDYPLAEQDYTKAAELSLTPVTALQRRAELYLEDKQDPTSALNDVMQALKHEPRSLRLIYLRARILLDLRRASEAVADFRTVASLCPKGEDLRNKAIDRLRELGVR